MSPMDSRRRSLRTSVFGISVWRGTASTAPVFGFVQGDSASLQHPGVAHDRLGLLADLDGELIRIDLLIQKELDR